MFQNSVNSWKAFSPSVSCGSIFPAKSCWGALRGGNPVIRGQVIWWRRQKPLQPSSSKFSSAGCVTCDWAFALEENWDLSVDQCWLQALQFSVYVIDLLSRLLRCNGLAKIQKSCSGPANSDHNLFSWCKFGFRKCFGTFGPTTGAGLHWLSYKVDFSTHVTTRSRKGSLLLCRVREDDTSKPWFLWFAVSS